MPSYRVSLEIGIVKAGVDPATLLPRAVNNLQQTTLVESNSVEIVAGVPMIRLRFLALHDRQAVTLADSMREHVSTLASTGRMDVLARRGNRWQPARR
ncbi:hypothetical protein LWF01_08330 [Saxibacter everestensis]|uniref:Uncharacterized protein n=1 Tax=Saxibacter everestensis TaxID=2909229 RepID=A0ABY8QXJ8_9MICO|nr:hypothetical protein LWF01_08330 [Brevibacteriaceae bacterium ZFBP1038]